MLKDKIETASGLGGRVDCPRCNGLAMPSGTVICDMWPRFMSYCCFDCHHMFDVYEKPSEPTHAQR